MHSITAVMLATRMFVPYFLFFFVLSFFTATLQTPPKAPPERVGEGFIANIVPRISPA